MGANDQQVGGDHYKGNKTQHWDWAQHKCYLVGAASKYLDRHDNPDPIKGGIKAVTKAVHYIQKLIERDYPEYELVFEVRKRVASKPMPPPTLTPEELMALDSAYTQEQRASEAKYHNPYRFVDSE
jgi:hypothetical protein